MARQQAAGMYGRITVLFAVAFLVLLVVLALLGQFGLSATLLGTILGGATLLTFALVGLSGGTLETSQFHLAGRSLSPATGGMAGAAGAVGGGLYLGLAGTSAIDPWTASAIVMGWALGFLILSVAIAPYIRKSGAFGVADFLGIRYGGRLVRLAAVLVVAVSVAAALAAALATGAFVTALLFNVSREAGLALTTGIVLCTTVLGGMRTITRTALLQYVVMAVAFILPLAIISTPEYELPIPQLTFGFAWQEIQTLTASGSALGAIIPGNMLPLTWGGNLIVIIVSVAAGVATLPHLAFRSAMVANVEAARRFPGWGLLFLLVIVLAAPAYAAFAKLVLLRDLAGTGLEMLPDWIFTFGQHGLVTICNADADSVAAVLEACRSVPGFTGNLNPSDISIGADALVLAAPAIFDLPYVVSALVALGALAAATATAGALAFALASAVGHDGYGGVVDSRASAGRQLIVTRMLLILVILGAAWIAMHRADEAFALAVVAISLSAGGLFPAMILAVWWKRANAAGAVAGIAAGSIVTLGIVLEHQFPGLMPGWIPNPGRIGFDGMTAGIIGMPVGFAAAIAASLLTPAPSAAQDALLDAIRRPGGTPFVQESES